MLAEVGMLAAGRGDIGRADTIFGALRQLRPDRAYPLVGLAVARMNAGRAGEAAELLEPVRLVEIEEHAQVLAWRGLALQLAGNAAQSQRVLTQAAALSGEGASLARGMLGLGENTR